jgi:DNA-binding NtrC family response regulator
MASFNPALAGRGRRILVADEDPQVVAFIIRTLRADGHAVFQAYAGLSATELAFAIDECHLVITNSRVGGLAGIDLVYELRARLPELPIVYLANLDRSTPAIEAQLPNDVSIIREPFTAEELRDVVNRLLYGSRRTVASGDGSSRDG